MGMHKGKHTHKYEHTHSRLRLCTTDVCRLHRRRWCKEKAFTNVPTHSYWMCSTLHSCFCCLHLNPCTFLSLRLSHIQTYIMITLVPLSNIFRKRKISNSLKAFCKSILVIRLSLLILYQISETIYPGMRIHYLLSFYILTVMWLETLYNLLCPH